MRIRPLFRRSLCVAAVAASCAAVLPAPAWADDDTATATPPATEPAPATEDLTTALVDEATRAVEEAVDGATQAVEEATTSLDTDSAPTTGGGGAVPADGTAEVPEQVAEPDGTVPAPASDPASADGSEADTTSDSADTASDSTAPATGSDTGVQTTSPAPAGTGPAVAPLAGAVNVNVSVRIGSAGDNGSLSQTNATVVPSSTASTAPATGSAGTGSTAPSTVAPSESTSSPWYWEWNCRDLPSVPVVSPSDSTRESLPTSWTWIWNCVGNSEQYHSAADQQYQQSNTNISIRISSPGNDGPVTQTNVAISAGGSGSVSLPAVVLPTISVTTPAIVLPSISVATPAIAVPSITVATPAIGVTIPSAGGPAIVAAAPFAIPTAVADAEVTIGWPLEIDVAAAGEARPAPSALVETPGPMPLFAVGDEDTIRAGGRLSPPRPMSGLLAAPIDAVMARSDSPPPSHSDARRETREAKATPRWTPSKVASDPKAPASGTSASAAGPGGSPGGGLPIFLALPFIAAALDLARRVAVDRATWPTGHRRRVPDTPG